MIKTTKDGHEFRVIARSYNARESKPRVYVSADSKFNLLEDLKNRTRRPHAVWRPIVLEILEEMGFTMKRMNWSQYAGCSSCPCSPGFISTGIENHNDSGIWRYDIYITLTGTDTVDESKPERIIV